MLSFLALGTLDARADDPPAPLPSVGVVGLHQSTLDDSDQTRASAALVGAIESSGRFDGRGLLEVARALRGRENVVLEEGLSKTARQNLANGRTAAAQAAWDEARGWLDAAVADFERTLPGSNATDDLWGSHVLIGATWLQQDPPDEGAARAAFSRAVALSPQRPIDPAQFPPNVTDVFTALQTELVAQAVEVEFQGQGRLWVDGVDRGALPTKVPGLVPGAHFALSRGDGRQGFSRFDVVGGGSPPEVVLVPGAPSLGSPSDSPSNRSAQVSSLYTAVGKRAEGVDYVLLGGVDGAVLHLQLYDSVRGVFSRAVELPYIDDCDDEAVSALPLLLPVVGAAGTFSATAPTPAPLSIADNVALAGILTQPPALPLGSDPTTLPPTKRSKVPLVLGIVGGALLVGGGTTAVVLLGGPPPDPTGTVIVNF